jgi:hypothetical protein
LSSPTGPRMAAARRPAYSVVMAQPLTADDLLPLVAKLPYAEQVRLAQLALRAARDGSRDATAYQAAPVRPDEFSQEEDSAAWEGEGWEETGAPR